jgi:hypothetical protein
VELEDVFEQDINRGINDFRPASFYIVICQRGQNTDLMTFNRNIGMLLLAIYLILVGLTQIFGFVFGILLGVIALLAGIFILLGR